MDFATSTKLPYLASKYHDRRPNLGWCLGRWPCRSLVWVHIPPENTKIYAFLCIRRCIYLRSSAADVVFRGIGAHKFLLTWFCHCHKVVASKCPTHSYLKATCENKLLCCLPISSLTFIPQLLPLTYTLYYYIGSWGMWPSDIQLVTWSHPWH